MIEGDRGKAVLLMGEKNGVGVAVDASALTSDALIGEGVDGCETAVTDVPEVGSGWVSADAERAGERRMRRIGRE